MLVEPGPPQLHHHALAFRIGGVGWFGPARPQVGLDKGHGADAGVGAGAAGPHKDLDAMPKAGVHEVEVDARVVEAALDGVGAHPANAAAIHGAMQHIAGAQIRQQAIGGAGIPKIRLFAPHGDDFGPTGSGEAGDVAP